MIVPKDRVLVGVSGGADSMCLLYILLQLREQLGFELHAAHVNHGLRDIEATKDQELVERYCDKWEIPLSICNFNLNDEAKIRKRGIEECGRELRYEFFRECCEDGKIALAHTLSDRIETLVFNLARGASLRGLCSIPYKRPEGKATVIRPLLDFTRDEVEAYCTENNIEYAIDSTNVDVNYARNRVRHNVLPQLRKINPYLERSVGRMLEGLSEDNAFLEKLALKLLQDAKLENNQYNADILSVADEIILRRALRMILVKNEIPISSASIARLESVLTGGNVSVGGNVLASCRRGILTFKQEIRNIH